MNLKEYIPEPFKKEEFELLQEGIYDNPQVSVYISQQKDFAFLYPQPEVDYIRYESRVKKLNLENYKKKKSGYERRFAKIAHLLKSNISNLVEIGAAEGAFLEIVRHEFPRIKLSAVESDQITLPFREKLVGSANYQSLDEICNSGDKYDVICLFHVLEHILNPSSFLIKLRQLMYSDSLLIIEVPSLFDPLLSLYNCSSYRKFYFQNQHPFVYSKTSIVRLMEHNDFQTKEVINYQRYGLENHLNWIINNSPGGNRLFRKTFCETNKSYIDEIESKGKTDTVIFVGNVKRKKKCLIKRLY